MESMPRSNEQPRFEGDPAELRPGNTVRYHADEGGYFVTQFGFRLDSLPEGMRIRKKNFSVVVGVGMPDCEGTVVQKDGKTLFKQERGEAAFSESDIIEVVALPEPRP
jgi:uncharacterized protein YneR